MESLITAFENDPGSLTYNHGIYDLEKFVMHDSSLSMLDAKKVGASYDGRLRPLKFGPREYHAFALKNIYELGIAKGFNAQQIKNLYKVYQKGYQKQFKGDLSKPAKNLFGFIHLLDKIELLSLVTDNGAASKLLQESMDKLKAFMS